MNLLYNKFLDYKQIANYRVEYELDNGINLSVKLELSAFPHLIGLHKLTDMPIIRRFNDPNDKVVSAKYITQKIKQQKILTDSSVRASQKSCDIEERYNNFSKENLLSLSYTEAIVNFNPSKIGSTLKSDFIFLLRITDEADLSLRTKGVIIKQIDSVIGRLNENRRNISAKVGDIMHGRVLKMEWLERFDAAVANGEARGEQKNLIKQICRKLRKGKSYMQIADDLEEDVSRIKAICDTAAKFAPDYDETKVIDAVLEPIAQPAT